MDKRSQFTNIIKTQQKLLYKISGLYTNSQQDREDLFQEILFQLWKSFETFKEQSSFTTWMYKVAMNTAIYSLKQQKRQINTKSIDVETEQLAEISDQSEEQRSKSLYETIKSLNLMERGIILLYLEGKSHQEISEVVGITTSNVGTKISRIKEKLKTRILKIK